MSIERDLPGFDDVIAVLRRGPSEVIDEMPPPSLWASIESALVEEEGGSVVSLADRRSSRWGRPTALAVGAVAAAALVAVPVALALRNGDPSVRADLAALPGFESATGQAAVDNGVVRIEVEGLTPIEGEYYEAWLLKFDGDELADLTSLGLVANPDGTYPIPEGINLDEFDTVDISIEADDGDPSHSGKSVLRGQLNDA